MKSNTRLAAILLPLAVIFLTALLVTTAQGQDSTATPEPTPLPKSQVEATAIAERQTVGGADDEGGHETPRPPAPSGVSAVGTSRSAISISWSHRDGISSYLVERYVGSPRKRWVTVADTSGTSATATGLHCGTTYTFAVAAFGDGNRYRATYSLAEIVSGTTYACPPTTEPTDPPPSPIPDTSPTLPNVSNRSYTAGQSVSLKLPSASGGDGTLRYTVSGLPGCLSFNSATRTISGTCNAAGSWTVTYRVRDADGDADSKTFTIAVTATPTPDTSPTLPNVSNRSYTAGQSVSLKLPSASGGDGTLRYTVSGLPSCLSFNSATRTISGTCNAAGSWTVTYRVRDADGDTDSKTFTIAVTATPTPDTSPTLPNVSNRSYTAGQSVSLKLPSASGGDGTLRYTVSGLPGCLSFNSATRTISGTCNAAGSWTVTYRVRDADGDADSKTFTIAVTATPTPDTSPTLPNVSNRSYTAGQSVSLKLPSASGGDGTLRYTVSGLPSCLSFSSVTRTISGTCNAVGSWTVTYRVRDTDGDFDTETFTIKVQSPPTITIEPQNATITEGQPARFVLRAKPVPTTDLRVKVDVSEGPPKEPRDSSYLTGDIPTEITIASGAATAHLTLQTEDDAVDEADGTIYAAVLSDTSSPARYTLGIPSSTSVIVRDNDVPPAPTGLRANGHLVNGKITLRWNAVPRATSYNVRYAEELCNSETGVCYNGTWQTEKNIPTGGFTVMEAALGVPGKDMLYRLQVRATNNAGEESTWSDFAFVYSSDSPLGVATRVATAPFHGYQPNKNPQDSHVFEYVICEETITPSITTSATDPNLNRSKQDIVADIENAVAKWEDAVKWNLGKGNIIATDAYELYPGFDCASRSFPVRPLSIIGISLLIENQVAFTTDGELRRAFCLRRPLILADGCWRSSSWTAIQLPIKPIDSISYGVILLRESYGADWNFLDTNTGCTFLHQVVVHEAGHAFGIGKGQVFRVSYSHLHPTNTTRSVMSEDDPNDYCKPQAYDIVAAMALYQSR